MKDENKTREQLIAELVELRRRVEEIDRLREKFDHAQQRMRKAVIRANDEKARADGIIGAIGDGISIQDMHFKVLYQNDIHKALVGEHEGEYCYEAYQKKAHVCDGCHVALSFKDGKIHKKEQFRDTDKGKIYYEIISSPLRNAQGVIVAGIEAVRDITERKKIEADLRGLVLELREALAKVNVLSGLLPICAWCKKVRDDKGYWQQVEHYIEEHSDASFTHGICPECMGKVDQEQE